MKAKIKSFHAALVLGMFAIMGAANVACSSKQLRHVLGVNEETQLEAEVQDGEEEEDVSASGSELWAANCMRCHNMRSPSSYSDTQWDVAVHHMRLRANLTAEEAEKIAAFLRSAN